MTEKTYPVPDRLNSLLVGGVLLAAIGLLWLGTRLPGAWILLPALGYSFVLLTNYALIHEATHSVLHSDPRRNHFFGMILGWLFPISFTVLRVTHIVHHCCNRTDHEMFDCYYAGDNRLIKYIQWYGLLLGLWWILIPIGTLLLAVVPRLLVSSPFRRARSTAVLFDDFGAHEIRWIRLEVLGGILFWITVFIALGLNWSLLAIYYACFAFNWSTRQYVTHAFTRRDVRDGALNLRVSPVMKWVLLNGHWDLVHHQHPHVSWYYLEKLGRHSEAPVSYWRQYLRLWRGPRPCTEAGPAILPKTRYQEM